MKAKGFFVTGTDTGCGKTGVSLGLMHRLKSAGLSVLAVKPVASGAESTQNGLRNADATQLRQYASRPLPYEEVNPYVFEWPIAPHLAAAKARIAIDPAKIHSIVQRLGTQCDRLIVEGVGGWRVPLGPEIEVADLAGRLGLPVILVVGLRLGCINHALLSMESILGSGVEIAGWVANIMDPNMVATEANLATLREMLPVPCLGEVPWLAEVTPARVAAYLEATVLA